MLYPEITPHNTDLLDRGLHKIYYEQSGNKNGIPIVFLHGGPGSGTLPWQRRFFNPDKFNIILFDQRGCGKSIPYACLEENTTDNLVGDIHALKQHLNIDKWHVIGGSWGSTLAIAYADKFADEILSLIMWGIFLCRERELTDLYFTEGVASHIFPEAFDEFLSVLPEENRSNPIVGYHKILTSGNKELIKNALRAWKKWEISIARLEIPKEEIEKSLKKESSVESFSLIENHYFMNKGFMDGDYLLKTIGEKVNNIPVTIVQGRYDMVCPAITAYELHKAIPHSKLYIIPNVGHSSKEEPSLKRIIYILDNL